MYTRNTKTHGMVGFVGNTRVALVSEALFPQFTLNTFAFPIKQMVCLIILRKRPISKRR